MVDDVLRVLFVCMGNICRSPLAEVVVRDRAIERGLSHFFAFASAGTGSWHIGNKADSRSIATARRYGHDLSGHRAQQITALKISSWQWYVPMDSDNRANLISMGVPKNRVLMMRQFESSHGHVLDVPDPYYGGEAGFVRVYRMLNDNADPILDFLVSQSRSRSS